MSAAAQEWKKGKRASRFLFALFSFSLFSRTSMSQEKSKRPMISREEDIGACERERERMMGKKDEKKKRARLFFFRFADPSQTRK